MVKTSFALLAEGERALRSKEQEASPDRISCQRRPAARRILHKFYRNGIAFFMKLWENSTDS